MEITTIERLVLDRLAVLGAVAWLFLALFFWAVVLNCRDHTALHIKLSLMIYSILK
jgi:hypothetical protein